ncbi:hypothetical protein GYMLUDRAFT_72846 [Collybiopsis luxurians FD-317 M1]|uniref:ATP-dependent DNA helicase n=1 Tax=Collybiopsis luxurians FD-317 M1 TaxID=944289 RepID=A0A0D0C270_9AGAR|nr:hypothetical protein GYMLUDRAFT_72846 [Collybiopsis luxurians FD-317 M1]
MIFVGDFAQLPPVGGENALWHQVNTVVILRKNMRNQGQSVDDVKFRRALENMRYKACTPEDIQFLKTLVLSNKPGCHYIGSAPWQDAPIIVGENRQKDEINRLGCLRYAADTSQKLTDFYSTDSIMMTLEEHREKSTIKCKSRSKVNTMSAELQRLLWELPPSSHENHATPVLTLCTGLPVIIRYNVATELNITKGQRATVYSWHASKGQYGNLILDTLFVQLKKPPTPVNLDGLPTNVIPLLPRKNAGYVLLPDDSKLYVTRLQIDVLPGFAMTAMDKVMIMLNSLHDHHAFYTALSQCRSVVNTTILQGFDPRIITGGASGSLRKEFCQLELLDDITRLRYKGELGPSVQGNTHSLLIESFCEWKGKHYRYVYLNVISQGFNAHRRGELTLETVRDNF